MPPAGPFEALADANRRSILSLLGDRARSVQELADELPISRPAVSRHLRVLKEAGMVTETVAGTRRIYRVRDEGLDAVEGYLASVWGDVARRFTLAAENTRPRARPVTAPLHLEFVVRCDPAHAFDVWTARTSLWWPPSHSVSGDAGLAVVIEPFVGGRIFERTAGGDEHDWGEVTAWQPPRRLAYLWHLRRDRSDATDVAVTFEPVPDGSCRVVIDHRGWERLGAAADESRRANAAGWGGLLPHFQAAAEA